MADILKGLHTHNYGMKHTHRDSAMCTETLEMPKKKIPELQGLNNFIHKPRYASDLHQHHQVCVRILFLLKYD